jgi:polyisoprenoid-binding protein YceI
MNARFAVPAPIRHRAAVLATALALASPALAADTYTFDKAHTTVGFQVRHIVTMLGGKFQDFSGTLQVDRARPESSSVEFTIQAASISTNDAKRDEHLKSPDFFDVAKYPTITFKSASVKPAGNDVYQVTGELTMHGITKTITLPVTFLGEGKDPWGNEKMGFEIATTLDRQDYGVSWNKTLDQGGVLVGDEVKVQVSVEANKVKRQASN